ncbi:helix-turn-helix transcriptional regulator [Roseomonas hellenica]|uniref:Helix-turn-helix transcriptional regulator n=1 Tax=Plastoroseomonas hellenica TaxID=2687306 RepID=A0ABS5EYF1_9PROT|nr:helix-turn-helix transcriptional regulator [Plastoroseomonas hellenica]MBR0665258.1 helix-turn-helix transcriptional regulator [Plastoroseomonas hellenica]
MRPLSNDMRGHASAQDVAGALHQGWRIMLEAIEDSALLTNADARVMFANRDAEMLLRHGEWLRLRDGRLHAARPVDQARLSAAIRSAVLSPGLQRQKVRIAIGTAEGGIPCIATIGTATGLPFAEAGLPRPAALLILRDPSPSVDAALLRALFGLTDAEARIAAHIAQGLPLRVASRCEGVAHSTARTHLQAVFGKVGVHSQSALASVLARLPRRERQEG